MGGAQLNRHRALRVLVAEWRMHVLFVFYVVFFVHHQIEDAACARRRTVRPVFSHDFSSGLERLVDLALNLTHHQFT